MDPAPRIPPVEEQIRALLIQLSAVAGQRSFSPVENAHERQQQRVRAQVRNAGTLVQKRIRPPRSIISGDVLLLGEPLARIFINLIVAESPEPVPSELPVIEASLVIPNQAGCDKHAG